MRAVSLVLVALMTCASLVTNVRAQVPDDPAYVGIDEVKSTFTLSRKPVPPLLFRDLGDGDLADSANVLDSADVAESSRYAASTKTEYGWTTQRGSDAVEAAYRFVGMTENGLLAVVTRFNGGGSGTFYSLHILDVEVGAAYDADGHRFRRIELKTVRAIPLGDRWSGQVSINRNTIVVRGTVKLGDAANSMSREYTAQRP